MATNTNKGYRKGSVDQRTQVYNKHIERWIKRAPDGTFMDVKSDGKPFKGVAKEVDDRRS
jgi:hypothetical protein